MRSLQRRSRPVFAFLRPSSAAPVVVIPHASWRGRFRADPAILGRVIVLDAVPRSIVGVLPPGVRYPVTDSKGEVFSPLGRLESDLAGRANRSVTVLGRLKPGVPLRQAQADLDRVADRLAVEYPATNRDVRARVDRYADRVTASSAALLRALWGAVMLVWFVACANAAGLVAIRNASRAREFATRLSLGATRARLSAQVLTESLALATVADEQFARQYLGPGDPLDRRLRLARSNVWMPIVGVAGRIVTRSLEVPARPRIYLLLFGVSLHFTLVLVRTTVGPPMARLGELRAVARGWTRLSRCSMRRR